MPNSDHSNRRQFNKAVDRMLAEFSLSEHTGAGFPVDQALREFFKSANERYQGGGSDALPASWVVIERFTKFQKEPGWFQLRPEKDHIFDFVDFLLFTTSDAAPRSLADAALKIPEGIVHNFTPAGDWATASSFESRDGTRAALCGVSLVRRGSEIAILSVGGQVCDLAQKSEELRDLYRNAIKHQLPLRSGMPELDIGGIEATPVPGSDAIWQHLALTLIDTDKQVALVRYLYEDHGRSYAINTDDPEYYAALMKDYLNHPDPAAAEEAAKDPSDMEIYKRSIEKFGQLAILMNLTMMSVLLPAYFEYRRPVVQQMSVKTSLDLKRQERSVRKQMDLVPAPLRPLTRRVAATRNVPVAEGALERFTERSGDAGDQRSYTPPAFAVSVGGDAGGFWRRLKYPDHFGKDPSGNPVQGWTWVKSHLRWRDRPLPPPKLYVKTPLSAGYLDVIQDTNIPSH